MVSYYDAVFSYIGVVTVCVLGFFFFEMIKACEFNLKERWKQLSQKVFRLILNF